MMAAFSVGSFRYSNAGAPFPQARLHILSNWCCVRTVRCEGSLAYIWLADGGITPHVSHAILNFRTGNLTI